MDEIFEAIPQNTTVELTEADRPKVEFKTLSYPTEDSARLDEKLAEMVNDGWRIIHQNDAMVVYSADIAIVHIVRLQRTIKLKEVGG